MIRWCRLVIDTTGPPRALAEAPHTVPLDQRELHRDPTQQAAAADEVADPVRRARVGEPAVGEAPGLRVAVRLDGREVVVLAVPRDARRDAVPALLNQAGWLTLGATDHLVDDTSTGLVPERQLPGVVPGALFEPRPDRSVGHGVVTGWQRIGVRHGHARRSERDDRHDGRRGTRPATSHFRPPLKARVCISAEVRPPRNFGLLAGGW
jgi:hypothetical protein